MSFVSTYLNFMGKTEEAMKFYAKAFGAESTLKITRYSEMPAMPGEPSLPEIEMNLVLHAELTIVGGHKLMATDMLESMGHTLRIGNNITINLNLDSREEADRLYNIFAEGSEEKYEMTEMPFGYWGCALDKYGIRWMINVAPVTAAQ
jgi:PhnB protein